MCYPAKLLHGHVEALVEAGVDAIFYPCMPYNFDEGAGDNNYNCPVVAYYPELLAANVPELKQVRYLYPYFGLHRPRDMERKAGEWFFNEFQVPKREAAAAVRAVREENQSLQRERAVLLGGLGLPGFALLLMAQWAGR